MTWYFHVDMDAFFASVEQVLNPALRGKPVIVGGRDGRGVVTSASYEARKYGVHSAMPGYQAKRLCPDGIFVPNRHRLYREYSEKVFAILAQYSPDVHVLSIDEGLVDLTGTEKLFGPPLKIADQIIRRINGELDLSASGGLSGNRVVAKIAATMAKPHGLVFVSHGCEEAFLAPLPVKVIPGIGPKAQAELARRGIGTIAELLAQSTAHQRYLELGDVEAGRGTRDHSIGCETTLAKPLTEREQMAKVLWELVETVGGRLRREELYSRCLTLKLRYSDFKTVTRSRTLLTPTRFDREIFAVVWALLDANLLPEKPVRLLGVSASALQSIVWQEPLFEVEKRRAWERLYSGIDRLRAKYGDETIGVRTAPPRHR